MTIQLIKYLGRFFFHEIQRPQFPARRWSIGRESFGFRFFIFFFTNLFIFLFSEDELARRVRYSFTDLKRIFGWKKNKKKQFIWMKVCAICIKYSAKIWKNGAKILKKIRQIRIKFLLILKYFSKCKWNFKEFCGFF